MAGEVAHQCDQKGNGCDKDGSTAGMEDMKTEDAGTERAGDENAVDIQSGAKTYTETAGSDATDSGATDVNATADSPTDPTSKDATTRTDDTRGVHVQDISSRDAHIDDFHNKNPTAEETRKGKLARLRKKHDHIVLYFKTRYPVQNLETWQAVCRDVGVDEGASISAYKKNLKKFHYNTEDFVDASRRGEHPCHFPTVKSLAEYTKFSGKVSPLECAKELQWMLVPIWRML